MFSCRICIYFTQLLKGSLLLYYFQDLVNIFTLCSVDLFVLAFWSWNELIVRPAQPTISIMSVQSCMDRLPPLSPTLGTEQGAGRDSGHSLVQPQPSLELGKDPNFPPDTSHCKSRLWSILDFVFNCLLEEAGFVLVLGCFSGAFLLRHISP